MTTALSKRAQFDDRDGQHLADMIELIIRSLVEEPEAVTVKISYKAAELCLSVVVAPDDVGKVVGRHGRTARSLRIILEAAAKRYKRFASLSLEAS